MAGAALLILGLIGGAGAASHEPPVRSVREGFRPCYGPSRDAVAQGAWADIVVMLDYNGLVETAKIVDYEPLTGVGVHHARAAVRALHFCAPYQTRETKVLLRIKAPDPVKAPSSRAGVASVKSAARF